MPLLSKVLFNQLVNRIPKSLDYKFNNSLIGPKNFYEKVICNVLVRKLGKSGEKYSDKNKTKTYEFWEGEGGLSWFTETNNDEYKISFKEQSDYMIKEINLLISSQKIKNLCLIDISTGNGNYLDFLTKEINNAEIRAIGFDINGKIINKNLERDDLKHIEFKQGLLTEHEDYILNLSKNNTICFFSRKSLTLYNNNEFNGLLNFLNKIRSSAYFFIIEVNNFNYKKEIETEYRDSPIFYGHNYPLIFKKNNWKMIWSKKKYINIFINDHWIYYGFSKK